MYINSATSRLIRFCTVVKMGNTNIELPSPFRCLPVVRLLGVLRFAVRFFRAVRVRALALSGVFLAGTGLGGSSYFRAHG